MGKIGLKTVKIGKTYLKIGKTHLKVGKTNLKIGKTDLNTRLEAYLQFKACRLKFNDWEVDQTHCQTVLSL